MYDRSKLDEIKLEDICNLYGVEVKRNGKNLIGRLRNEKTPSFCIYENNNIWIDFGTNEKGGSIKLIQKLEGVGWNEAIKILADRFNISKTTSNSSLPTKRQFEFIGINSDRTIANFIIDLSKHSLEKVEEWEEKYSISMYELSEKNISMYHKILDSRALPIIYEERNYFKYLQEQYPLLEKEIEKGKIRKIHALKLGYCVYFSDEGKNIYTIYPVGMCECDYTESAKEELKKSEQIPDERKQYYYKQLVINAQTGQIEPYLIEKQELAYYPPIITWEDVQ